MFTPVNSTISATALFTSQRERCKDLMASSSQLTLTHQKSWTFECVRTQETSRSFPARLLTAFLTVMRSNQWKEKERKEGARINQGSLEKCSLECENNSNHSSDIFAGVHLRSPGEPFICVIRVKFRPKVSHRVHSDNKPLPGKLKSAEHRIETKS
ncbi:uncharacterized protein V6R79_015939 [Siganus canaliculatus]